jgi:hypothetical protein
MSDYNRVTDNRVNGDVANLTIKNAPYFFIFFGLDVDALILNNDTFYNRVVLPAKRCDINPLAGQGNLDLFPSKELDKATAAELVFALASRAARSISSLMISFIFLSRAASTFLVSSKSFRSDFSCLANALTSSFCFFFRLIRLLFSATGYGFNL